MITSKKLNSVLLASAVLILFLNLFSSTASAATTTSNVSGIDYQYEDWGQYPVIDLFGEKYVTLLEENYPIWQSHVDKLAKLVIDDKTSRNLVTGEILDIGQGYSLQVKQVDVDGQKVWLELDKDGEYVGDQIISTNSGDDTWNCTLDNIQGVNNVLVFKIHVNQVFQGAADSIVRIDGIWLIDYANSMTLKVGDQFGDYTLTKIISGVDASNLGSLVFESSYDSVIYAYITNFKSNTVSVIDTTTDTVKATVKVGDKPYGVAVSPDGKKVYVTNHGSNTVSVINTSTSTVTATVPLVDNPNGIAVSPDGSKIYVTTSGSNISVIDSATNNVTAKIYVRDKQDGIVITPDGTKIYVIKNDFGILSISVIDTETNNETGAVFTGICPLGIAVAPDGKSAYVTDGDWPFRTFFIDTATNQARPISYSMMELFDAFPSGVDVSPDSKIIYVATDRGVAVINITTETVIAIVPGSSPDGVAVTPDGKKVYAVNSGSDNVSVIDTGTNTVVASVDVGDCPIAFGKFTGYVQVPKPVLPVADFSASQTLGKRIVRFTDESTGSPTSWYWDFGDGGNSTVQNPVHKYSKSGTYKISLTVKNIAGEDTKTRLIFIF